MAERNFTKLLKLHAQQLKQAVDATKSTMSIPGDMGLKNLIEEFTQEFSTKSPGVFPGQIMPQKLMNYYHQFNQIVPGFAERNAARVGSDYSRDITRHLMVFVRLISQALHDPNVQIPWLLNKVGSLFVRGGSFRGQLTWFVDARLAGLQAAL